MEENKVATDSSAPNAPELTRLSGARYQQQESDGNSMNIRCWLIGHRYMQLPVPTFKPKNWTHTLYCTHCGKTLAFVNAEFPAEHCANEITTGVGVSEETDTV